ncbi:MAG: ADP-ribosylglycohydrolase family protein [Planctomycetaceae bacterium]
MSLPSLPADHAERMRLVRLSLEGLSIGDAFGEQFFHFPEWIARREAPPPRWRYTDDTAMAAGLCRVLAAHGDVVQDELARVFAEEYVAEPHRGYGGSVQGVLRAIHGGTPWREAATLAFPEGSWGNGGAMRVAPVGAYFHDDLERAADARP